MDEGGALAQAPIDPRAPGPALGFAVNNERPILRPSAPKPTFGYPVKINIFIDIRQNDVTIVKKKVNDLTWHVSYKIIEGKDNLRNIRVSLHCNVPEKRTILARYQITTESQFLQTVPHFEEKTVFDSVRRSVFYATEYPFPKTKENESVHQQQKLTVTVNDIAELEKFEWNNQVFPHGTKFLMYDWNDPIAIKVDVKQLKTLNPRFDQLVRDLAGGILSKREMNALFEFCGLFFNRWFFGDKKFESVIRNGYKLGFTKGWERWNRTDGDFPFQSRVNLPFYQHFGHAERLQPEGTNKKREDFRQIIQRYDIRLMDLDDPFLRCTTENLNDILTLPCQFTFYIDKTAAGHWLLMGGGIYQILDEKRYGIFLRVHLMKDQVAYLTGEGERLIHQKQNTFGMVIGVLDDEIIGMLRNNEMHFIVSSSQWITKDAIYNYSKVLSEETHQVTTVLSMPGPVNDVKWLKHAEEAYANGLTPMVPHPSWVGQTNAWITCLGNKRIGVSKEYLSHHSEYFRSKFYNTDWKDCGGSEVREDEDVEIVLEALNILWHRTHVLNTATYHRVIALAEVWLCPIIKNYVELAIITTEMILPLNKRDDGYFFDLDILNYILRNPQYASNFNVDLPEELRRKVRHINADELDAGKSVDGVDEGSGTTGLYYFDDDKTDDRGTGDVRALVRMDSRKRASNSSPLEGAFDEQPKQSGSFDDSLPSPSHAMPVVNSDPANAPKKKK
uniref:BTB domain-containing protein n=1 Tax=Caenorhabditis japonica TaxID=281687 RepID=A0A8R1I3V3_CAEJA